MRTDGEEWSQCDATVVRGHQVASGRGGDPRFPDGTLRMQWPHFADLGLSLEPYFPGTLNLSISPASYRIVHPWKTFRQVKWCPVASAEDFSFFHCRLRIAENEEISGLIYYPHPETKPEHEQPSDVLEVLAPWTGGIRYGDFVELMLPGSEIEIVRGKPLI